MLSQSCDNENAHRPIEYSLDVLADRYTLCLKPFKSVDILGKDTFTDSWIVRGHYGP